MNAIIFLAKHKEAVEFAMATQSLAPSNPEVTAQLECKKKACCRYLLERLWWIGFIKAGIFLNPIVRPINYPAFYEWGTRSNLIYTDKDIDEIRVEWAKHVLKFPEN
ncbi:uncharacterized protein LOC133746423 [Rosa rugosa]|uniref:uncharacterized protein LOC133746423 n=1 Tax=Rosa rugosa TaxID=74645 RepID=UPI002B413D6D|nr:uncharacterized protein LOC133746423 [Rosa rugosa]